MPLDSRIISGMAQPTRTAADNYDLMVKVQKDQDNQVVLAQKRADAQRAQEEDAAIRQILQESQGDLSDDTLRRITQIAPGAGMDLQKSVYENRKKLYDSMESEAKAEALQLQQGLSWLGAAKSDPSLYPRVRAMAIQKNGDLGKMLMDKPTYEPGVVDALLQSGLTAKEQIDANAKVLDAFRKGDYRYAAGVMAQMLPSMDPEDAKELAQGALFAGMPKPMLDAVLANPQAFALDEQQRQTIAGQAEGRQIQRENIQAQAEGRAVDDARQARTAAETARHNRAIEAAAATRAAAGGSDGGQRPLTQTAESNIINRLSNQWTSATKAARELERANSLMDSGLAAARRGDLAAGSQAVLVTFQKILDPNSVVRESEYDRSAAGQSMYNRVAGAMERLTQGGAGVRLSELEAFARLAKEATQAQTGVLNGTRERIGKTADRYNIPRELVLDGTFGADPDKAPASAPATTPSSGGMPTYADYLKRKRGGR